MNFIFSLLLTLLACADSTDDFFTWLESNKEYFKTCKPVELSDSYELCDKTKVSKQELSELFKLSHNEIIKYFVSKGIKVDIVDSQDKRLGNLFGKYLPLENKILVRNSASPGVLIHEYIHHLQLENQNEIFGKKYKFERSNLQAQLVEEIDQAILKSKETTDPEQSKKLIEVVSKASQKLMSFGYWQDLIDERNIFLLYINYGKKFDAKDDDLALARKNMSFICQREKLNDDICNELQSRLSYKKTVVQILQEVRPKLDVKGLDQFLDGVPKKSPDLKQSISNLNNYIFKKLKIKPDVSYSAIKNQDNILPDSTLKFKRAHCLGLSILYLLSAEKMDVDAYLVRVPGHVFVRFCHRLDCLNVETLKEGEIVTDKYYRDHFSFSERSIQDGFYLTSLKDEKELASSIYLGLGYVSSQHRQYDLAKYFYKKAIDHSRGFAEAYGNLAAIYKSLGQLRQAWAYTKMSVKINPDYDAGYINLGVLYQEEKNDSMALESYTQAIKINPISIPAYSRRAALYAAKNEVEKAKEDYEKVILIEPKSCDIMKKMDELTKSKKYEQKRLALLKSSSCVTTEN